MADTEQRFYAEASNRLDVAMPRALQHADTRAEALAVCAALFVERAGDLRKTSDTVQAADLLEQWRNVPPSGGFSPDYEQGYRDAYDRITEWLRRDWPKLAAPDKQPEHAGTEWGLREPSGLVAHMRDRPDAEEAQKLHPDAVLVCRYVGQWSELEPTGGGLSPRPVANEKPAPGPDVIVNRWEDIIEQALLAVNQGTTFGTTWTAVARDLAMEVKRLRGLLADTSNQSKESVPECGDVYDGPNGRFRCSKPAGHTAHGGDTIRWAGDQTLNGMPLMEDMRLVVAGDYLCEQSDECNCAASITDVPSNGLHEAECGLTPLALIDAVRAALGSQDEPLPEWKCPSCGATTRARMADHVGTGDTAQLPADVRQAYEQARGAVLGGAVMAGSDPTGVTIDEALGYAVDLIKKMGAWLRDGPTAETVATAMSAVEAAPVRLGRYVVSSREHEWIRNPTGRAPTWNAVQAALGTGAITGDHPEVRQLLDAVFPTTDNATPEGSS